MLKNLGYDGTYHDENISISLLLENPLDYGLEANVLLFSVSIKCKNGGIPSGRTEDFTFYVMDESNCLYNTWLISYSRHSRTMLENDEPIYQPDGLIHTDFKHEFLFQDMRIAFYYKSYEKINIIKLKH